MHTIRHRSHVLFLAPSSLFLSIATSDKLLDELLQRFNLKLPVGAIDVDVFCHKITKVSQLDELEHILSLFRETRRAVDVLDSTHHAVCRTYISLDCHDRLLPLLEKRIEYGIFPDDFIYNALMDHYLEKKEMSNAFRVACCYMLQENYSNTISKTLALCSALKWIPSAATDSSETAASTEEAGGGDESTAVAEKEADADDDDDENEPEYIRVPFLRNEYNDEHFDVTDKHILCGKIFHYIGMKTDSPLGINMHILGLCMTKNVNRVASVLQEQQQQQSSANCKFIASDLFNLICTTCKLESEDELTKLKASVQPFVTPSVTLDKLMEENLHNIRNLETGEVTSLQERMKAWIQDRQYALDAHLNELQRDRLIGEIQMKRQKLREKEKLLYFFENLDKIELELRDAEESIESLKKTAVVEEDYVPPTVAQSFSHRK